MRILSLAGRRLAASIPTLFLILIGVFLLLQFAPGDTVDAMMAQMGGGDAATARELRKFYGLDLSVADAARQLSVAAGPARSRLLLDLRQAGRNRDPGAAAADDPLDDRVAVLCVLLRPACFGVIAARGVNKWPDTLISTLGLDLLRHAVVLVRPDGHRGVLDLSAMAPGRRLRGYRRRTDRTLAACIDIAQHLILPTLDAGA